MTFNVIYVHALFWCISKVPKSIRMFINCFIQNVCKCDSTLVELVFKYIYIYNESGM